LLDEFTLDRVLLDKLRAITTVAFKDQIEPLGCVIQQNADNTAPAVCLLLALRRARMFEQLGAEQARCDSPAAIPRCIVQYWDSPVLPSDVLPLTQSWRTFLPDYEYCLFDDQKAQDFILEHCSPDFLRAYRRARHPAQKSDLFRLAYLSVKGGFYVDIDDRCLGHLNKIVPKTSHFVSYQEPIGTIANNFLGAIPGHPVIRRALELAEFALNRGDHDTLWLSTGPGLLTRAFAQNFVESEDRAGFLRRNVVLEGWRYHSAVAAHCKVGYKRTNLHWRRAARLQQ
jgi:mannosyltransferase OCH1-like enzyme